MDTKNIINKIKNIPSPYFIEFKNFIWNKFQDADFLSYEWLNSKFSEKVREISFYGYNENNEYVPKGRNCIIEKFLYYSSDRMNFIKVVEFLLKNLKGDLAINFIKSINIFLDRINSDSLEN